MVATAISSRQSLHYTLLHILPNGTSATTLARETENIDALCLTSAERERLWALSGIDSNIYVYNASENPDKPSRRWQESMQLLGGLAVMNGLRHDEGNVFLTRLCRIYHGEELDLSELGDRGRAMAFQQSIACKHSLYEYVKTSSTVIALFAVADVQMPHSPYAQLIRRIKSADREARQESGEGGHVLEPRIGILQHWQRAGRICPC